MTKIDTDAKGYFKSSNQTQQHEYFGRKEKLLIYADIKVIKLTKRLDNQPQKKTECCNYGSIPQSRLIFYFK